MTVKVYQIEERLFGDGTRWPLLRRAEGVAPREQEAMVEALVEVFGVDPIRFQRARGRGRGRSGRAWPEQRRVSIPPDGAEVYVAHEVAHVLAGPGAHHGPEWRWWHVQCVAMLCGDRQAERLAREINRAYPKAEPITVQARMIMRIRRMEVKHLSVLPVRDEAEERSYG